VATLITGKKWKEGAGGKCGRQGWEELVPDSSLVDGYRCLLLKHVAREGKVADRLCAGLVSCSMSV